jgi:hypothetical protein
LGFPAMLWNPMIQTSGNNFGVQSNQFGFAITGTPGIPITIQASTNLTIGKWDPIQSCNLTNGTLFFSDPESINYPSRYYSIQFP